MLDVIVFPGMQRFCLMPSITRKILRICSVTDEPLLELDHSQPLLSSVSSVAHHNPTAWAG